METVLVAFMFVILGLFAASTLTEATLSAANLIAEAGQTGQTRLELQARTNLEVLSARTAENGAVIELVLRNSGSLRLVDFDRWDVVAQYYDNGDNYRIQWLPFNSAIPVENQWGAAGIFFDETRPEDFERGVLNPGEQLQLQIRLMTPLKAGTLAQILISTETGSGFEAQLVGNVMPELAINTGVSQVAGETILINRTQLLTTDANTPSEQLQYTVTLPPSNGTLSLGDTFTQAEINAGLLSYSGTAPDSFGFTVTDGEFTLGSFTFTVMVQP
jgi:hypothetical protein